MNKLIFVLSLINIIVFPQTDVLPPVLDSVPPPIKLNKYPQEIKYLTIKENINCEPNELNIIDFNIIPCDIIDDKNLVPHKSHNWYIQSRIVELKTKNDTLDFKLIGLSQCCAKFELFFECTNDSTLGIYYKDVSDEMCFCGNCPYLFEGKLLLDNKKINKIYLNKKELEITKDIYNENVVRFIEEDSISGKKTIKTYIDKGYRYFSEKDLLLKQIIDKKTDSIQTKIYYSNYGIEVKE